MVVRDVAIADVTAADVFAPVGGTDLPVVVLFHGTEGLRARMEPLAVEVARSGAVAIVPSWPVITERPELESTEDPFLAQTAAAVCALRFAESTAAEYGGDPTDLTVVGHSGGAPLGARVALVGEPPWPGIDCYTGISPDVDRFVGTAGDYENEYQFGKWIHEVYQPYDLFELDITNRDLEVQLIHGVADLNVNLRASAAFDDRLDAEGIASDLLYIDASHGELINPSIPGGRFVADQLTALVHGQPSKFHEAGTRATMTFSDDRCSVAGQTEVTVDQPWRLRLVADSQVPVVFSMVGFEATTTDARMAQLEAAGPDSFYNVPEEAEVAGFVTIPAGGEGEMSWVFVQGAHRWIAYCMPEFGSIHPAEGQMHPAAEIVLVP